MGVMTLEKEFEELTVVIKEKMMVIPNIIDDSVPIGKDDSENVEVAKFGDPFVPNYEIPHHADIIANFNGLDKESAGRTSGVGFYYLVGDVARLHEAMLAYARDFMIDNGFTYCIRQRQRPIFIAKLITDNLRIYHLRHISVLAFLLNISDAIVNLQHAKAATWRSIAAVYIDLLCKTERQAIYPEKRRRIASPARRQKQRQDRYVNT